MTCLDFFTAMADSGDYPKNDNFQSNLSSHLPLKESFNLNSNCSHHPPSGMISLISRILISFSPCYFRYSYFVKLFAFYLDLVAINSAHKLKYQSV